MQAQPEAARDGGRLAQFLRMHGMRRCRRRDDDAAHGVGRGVVVASREPLDVGEVGVQRLRLQRGQRRVAAQARQRSAAAAKHEAQAQLVGLVEQDRRAVVRHPGEVVVVVVGHRGAAGERELHQADARGEAEHLFVHERTHAQRRRLQPGRQRLVDAQRIALEQGLERVVVRAVALRINRLLMRRSQVRCKGRASRPRRGCRALAAAGGPCRFPPTPGPALRG
jgi:hypothetical protein